MSKFLPLSEAAPIFGYGSGPAFRKAFERGLLPSLCLIRIGMRSLRVDVAALEAWLKEQPAYAPIPAKSEPS